MTREEISQYIIDKNLPLIYELNGRIYYLNIWYNYYYTTGYDYLNRHTNFSKSTFPNWEQRGYMYDIYYGNKMQNTDIDKFEKILSDLLFYLEVNKSRFTNIVYYND